MHSLFFFFLAQAEDFMNAYEQMRSKYVETRILKACRDSLNFKGIAILIGQQGCGKTLTAVQIMRSDQYREWKKLLFTSWEDLLTIEVEDKSLVYIDNILDGFIYQDIVQKWFNSLCHFFFEQTRGKKDIHILISCKQNVIEEALENIRADAVRDTILLKAESFPLTYEEKFKILKAQFQIAKTLKEIENPDPNSDFTFLKRKEFDIGFPMCAHMYAFETDLCEKKSIFTNPRTYVIHHIKNEIIKDNTNGAMTLFLILLFYTHSIDAKTMRRFDLKYGGKCREFLEGMVSKDFVDKMKLDFNNLSERANDLKDTILVKVSSMFEFKHQIYKEGVVDYFFTENATHMYSIKYFPLGILRSYKFSHATSKTWMHINRRLIKEFRSIQNIPMDEYELKARKAAEVFSCKIFECNAFEKEFSKAFEETLKKDCTLQDYLLNRKLNISFWIGRYHLNTLLKTAMNLVDQYKDHQFYQALLGECCKEDKRYSVHLTSDIDLDSLKKKVFCFQTSSCKSIQHLVLQSDKLDCDAHTILAKVLKDAADQNLFQDNKLLECSMEEMSCSRLLCILEILQRQNNLPTERIMNLISRMIEKMNSYEYNVCLELEMLVRVCILLIHFDIQELSPVAVVCPIVNSEFDTVKKMLSGFETTISEKTNLIRLCIEKCQTTLNLPSDTPANKNIPCIHNINLEFKEAVIAAIHLQEMAGLPFKTM